MLRAQRGAQSASQGGYGLHAGDGLGYGAAAAAAAQQQGMGSAAAAQQQGTGFGNAARLVTGAAAAGSGGELGSAKNPVYMMQVGGCTRPGAFLGPVCEVAPCRELAEAAA